MHNNSVSALLVLFWENGWQGEQDAIGSGTSYTRESFNQFEQTSSLRLVPLVLSFTLLSLLHDQDFNFK